MTLFAFRKEVGRVEHDALALAQTYGGELRDACFAPDPGIMLAVIEDDAPADLPPLDLFRVLPITAEEYGPPEAGPAAGDGDGLGLVLVRRRLDPMTQREFKTVALQAIMCAYEYTDLRWLRSYWATEQNELHCLFRTSNHALVREHARRSRIPCDEIYDAVPLKLP